MKKNSQIHLWIETEIVEKLKKEAETLNVSVAEIYRQRLRNNSPLQKIEFILSEIDKKIR